MEAFVCGSPAHDNGSLAGSTTDSVSHLKACMYIAVVGLQQGGIGSTAFHVRTRGMVRATLREQWSIL